MVFFFFNNTSYDDGYYRYSFLDQAVQSEFRHKRKNRIHGMGERRGVKQQPPLAELLRKIHDHPRTRRATFRHTSGEQNANYDVVCNSVIRIFEQ